MITIVDYDMGNVGSIKNMLEYLGYTDVEISSEKSRILASSHVILPGVGSFDEGMKNLESRGLDKILKEYALSLKKPLLGICLGMQLLGVSSQEGNKAGLGLIDFHSVKFRLSNNLKIPHMGWNTIILRKNKNHLTNGLDNNYRFYFVHSYYAECSNVENILLTTIYGIEFPSAVVKDNVVGFQFHPEKSHNYGMRILDNFIKGENNDF